MNKKQIKCTQCKQLLPRPIRPRVLSKDVLKIQRIMKKHHLTQVALSHLIKVPQPTISGWFTQASNKSGLIKPIYFEMLRLKGYL